jgi:hypothetical protein
VRNLISDTKGGTNKVLRRIFGPKRDEASGGWRKLIMKSFVICPPWS